MCQTSVYLAILTTCHSTGCMVIKFCHLQEKQLLVDLMGGVVYMSAVPGLHVFVFILRAIAGAMVSQGIQSFEYTRNIASFCCRN